MNLLTVCRAGALTAVALGIASAPARAQAFQHANNQMPPSNGYTENVDFGDVDGDGDFDAIFAQGGDNGDDQNDIWINLGHAQAGAVGWFADRTSTQFPALLDDSRDVEFVDLDRDGDLDIYVSNTSTVSNQSNRWWINMGGLQGGTQGYYQDQTPTRWHSLNGATSSIAPSVILASGGFIDFSCDCDFGDLDNDGDLDLVHSSYGAILNGLTPTRIFLNDGSGLFDEFNPSGYRLTGQGIGDGNPGLWCQGTQLSNTTNSTGASCDIASSALDIDVGDIDGDLDLDILHGARNEKPRMFQNRLVDQGALGFRDVTGAAFPAGYSSGSGHYEQEMGDCDNDNDIDIYGLNWQITGFAFNDVTLTNDGSGTFANLQVLSGSGDDDNEGDFFDYDNDGDLDLYIADFSGQDRLYRNNFTGTGGFSHTDVTNLLPTANRTALDADCADLDEDGDPDVMVANDVNAAEYYLINVLNVPDTRAPRCVNLEQAPGRVAGASPTVVRVQVYDNESYYVTWYANVVLEYRVVPNAYTPVPMLSGAGQIFRGEIPGNLVGTIEYRVTATDRHGNVGVSQTASFSATQPGVLAYCTSSTSSNGCNASMSAVGTPSASAASGFTLTATGVEGQQNGIVFYGINGRTASVWALGSTSFLCVKSPVNRMNVVFSGGTAAGCDGVLAIDWHDYMATHPTAVGQPRAVGQVYDAQAWFRDPAAPGTTNLSNGLEFLLGP